MIMEWNSASRHNQNFRDSTTFHQQMVIHTHKATFHKQGQGFSALELCLQTDWNRKVTILLEYKEAQLPIFPESLVEEVAEKKLEL